jgi:hypothetical protein
MSSLKAENALPASRSWAAVRRQTAAYTGGPVSVSHDGQLAACMCAERVALLDLALGDVVRTVPPEVPVSSRANAATGGGTWNENR